MRPTEGDRSQSTEVQKLLVEAIKKYVAESPLNCLKDIDGSPIWEEPLVGFADGDDPLFEQYKGIIGEFHLTPRQALAAHVGANLAGEPPEFPSVGVVSWVLPMAKETRLSNRKMTEGPSQRWNNTRFQGEEFNDSLRRHVASVLGERGLAAVPPMLTSYFKVHRLPHGWVSNWSERHAAYAAGLGTFSLSEGLITAKGVAHRCGSVVANVAFVPSPRRYVHHLEYCPFPHDGSCGVCIDRCPGGAIGPDGHDKVKCRETMFVMQASFREKPGYIGPYAGCGLCQTKVPCESRIPRRTGIKRTPKLVGARVEGRG